MKTQIVLILLLLPLCSGQNYIECYGQDFLSVNNLLLQCSGPKPQACYTRDSGEKGCTELKNCLRPGWTCCKTNRCNQ
ncbi:uncharacterized protein wu:fj16a03 [Boleophthalmus pectinirostris]|uniref:uncharacterized protein wu:fj16a03 n=1 Tax=Boleophthalmus pectinirostris TaxID=150288 RepID=UPI00243115E8|nr:uncharacterized protein wu:fj16a03 [Boleophthalmus pectinirostris]